MWECETAGLIHATDCICMYRQAEHLLLRHITLRYNQSHPLPVDQHGFPQAEAIPHAWATRIALAPSRGSDHN